MAAVPSCRRANFEESMSGMYRAIDALREWMQLRARLRDEHQFHLDRAADFRALGLSSRAANQTARGRFGSDQNLRLGLRELGGDWAGLIRLFVAHRVHASPWFQPTVLVVAILLSYLRSVLRRAQLLRVSLDSRSPRQTVVRSSFPIRRGTSLTGESRRPLLNPSSPWMA